MDVMDEARFAEIISLVVIAVEFVGVLVIVGGFIVVTAKRVRTMPRDIDNVTYLRDFRRDLGRVMLLGLDFLVAGDIIRTVVVSHTMPQVASLGLIVVIRTALVFTMHLEVEGRWPWQSADSDTARS